MRAVSKSVLGGVLALCASAASQPAQADEAYVCEGGRVAYVRFGQLEAMKRKDPCVAAYYGVTSDGRGDIPPAAVVDTDMRNGGDEVPRVIRTTGTATRTVSAPVLSVAPRAAAPGARPLAAPRRTAAASGAGTVGRVVAPPVAHPDTDFRNVRILNAAPGDSGVFRHAR